MEHLTTSLKISLAQISEKGPKAENQDTIGTRIPEGSALSLKGIAVALADGVSSSKAARQASQSAIAGFLTDYYATPDTWRTEQSGMQVIQSLNRYLWGQSVNNVQEEGYLTTFSALVLKGENYFLFHVGDSRIYRFRSNRLEQLTRDHTQKIDRHTTHLSRALGADSVLEVDFQSDQVQVGDIFVLTSDGVHDTISYEQFQNNIRSQADLDQLARDIVNLAEYSGLDDNISIQIVRVDALGPSSKDDAVTVLSQLPFPPPLSVGHMIDGNRVEKILHESERSQVYLVKNEQNRMFVMKTPSRNYDDDPAYIERFVMEAWVGSRIQNPHVVRVVQTEKERKFLYYLTEFVSGPTLFKLIQERAPIDIPDVIEFVETLIKGLRAFHRKDTLHQDLKPENIIVSANGPVIIDFGSCFVAGVDEVSVAFKRDVALGTLSYSAPEYRVGGRIGQTSDQFSLGVIVYEMLTGKLPFGEKYESANEAKLFQGLKYIPARMSNPLVPIWMDKAIEKSLSFQPTSRYTSLSEFLKDLKRPRPEWLTPEERPLYERHPLLVWKCFAALGWGVASYFLIKEFSY